MSRLDSLVIGPGKTCVGEVLNIPNLWVGFFNGCHAGVILAVVHNDYFKGNFLQCSVNRLQAIFQGSTVIIIDDDAGKIHGVC